MLLTRWHNATLPWQPKSKDTEQKRWLQSHWQRRARLGFCFCCAQYEGQNKSSSFCVVLGGDVQMHQVRLVAASNPWLWEVLPSERVNYLQPASSWFSPLHWQGRGGWWVSTAPPGLAGIRDKSDRDMSHTSSQTARNRKELIRPSASTAAVCQNSSQRHFIYFIVSDLHLKRVLAVLSWFSLTWQDFCA